MDRYSVIMNHTTIINGVEFEKGLHAITEEEANYFVTTPHRVTKNGTRLAMIPADMETKKDLMSVFGDPEPQEDEVDETEEDESTEDTNEVEKTEEVSTEAEATEATDEENVTTDESKDSEEIDPKILELREKYEAVVGKPVSNRYSNDIEYMEKKIAEASKEEEA